MNIIRRCLLLVVTVLSACASFTAKAQYTLTTLVTFNGTNGESPRDGLIADASGNLYGTTQYDTVNDSGTVFELAAGTHALSTLARFDSTNGSGPAASPFVDASGNLYGTTYGGGANDAGTVFKLAVGTHAITTLASFNITNGQNPAGVLIADASGNLYGTTSSGGANNSGTVFEVAAGTHTLSTLASFNGTNGSTPYGGLIADANGNMYGTTWGGGATGNGTVYEVAAGTHTLSALVSFNGTNGFWPWSRLIADASGNLYGTTYGGGANSDGTVFEVTAGTHSLITLASFNGPNGISSFAGLLADASGNLFGTTYGGGNLTLHGGGGAGTVFEVTAGTHELVTLVAFDDLDGAIPRCDLIADANGNLYGTTQSGGANGQGTVFELSPVPEPSTIVLAGCGLTTLALAALRRKSRQNKSQEFHSLLPNVQSLQGLSSPKFSRKMD